MAIFSSVSLTHLLVIFLTTVIAISSCCYASVDERKVYIVYLGSLPEGDYSPTLHHATILEDILEGSSVSDALVTSYKRSFNGFAAKLTEAERQRLASRGEVVSFFPSRTLQLQTSVGAKRKRNHTILTSWDFMGFLETSKRNHSIESDTIIGVIDSGIWLDSPSFSDVGFSTPPKKWKGVCEGGANFTCNKKVIGARNYITPEETVTDKVGHGSHTASTAAGNSVKGASFFGVGTGIARGGVPSARIAVYKVCSVRGCPEVAVLSAFDDAIADGVDILTVSLGSTRARNLTHDSLAIGSFHAMAKNILTVQSAGNSGSKERSVSSVAPWLFSVAASNTDRRFVSKVVLANGKEFTGSAVNTFSLKAKDYPIVSEQDAETLSCDKEAKRSCTDFILDPKLVKGKIVLCTGASGINIAFIAGAAGAIAKYDTDHSPIVPFPTSFLGTDDFDSVIAYYNSTKNARANIFKTEGLKLGSPPKVASFSSRGPNGIISDILKPDISAPGVDILAAYSMIAPIAEVDDRHTKYSVLSGTSMACPHVASTAAYVKTFHPNWSPSAIKSAIMTTAWPMNNTYEPNGGHVYEFAYGAGHIDPVKATDPGLVYEITTNGYIKMLCDIGLSQDNVRRISGDKSSCSNDSAKSMSLARELNYPSMTACLNTSAPISVHFTRTVTNVGSPRSVYKSTVTSHNNKAFKVVVEPSIMSFKSIGEKKTFNVTISSSTDLTGMYSASLVWSDGVHTVRSPIVLYSTDY